MESFFIIENIFLLKNLTDFGKTVETGLDPRLQSSHCSRRSHCQYEKEKAIGNINELPGIILSTLDTLLYSEFSQKQQSDNRKLT